MQLKELFILLFTTAWLWLFNHQSNYDKDSQNIGPAMHNFYNYYHSQFQNFNNMVQS